MQIRNHPLNPKWDRSIWPQGLALQNEKPTLVVKVSPHDVPVPLQMLDSDDCR